MAGDINGHCGDPREIRERKIRLASESYEQKKKKSITMNPTKWFKSPGNL